MLQLGYDDTNLADESGAQLLWQYDYTDGGGDPQVAWINAVLGNSDITDLDLIAGTLTDGGNTGVLIQDYLDGMRFEGSYEDYLADGSLDDPELGARGVDTDNNFVWAVIDHNSTFGTAVPEPSASLLFLFGSLGLVVRRRRA